MTDTLGTLSSSLLVGSFLIVVVALIMLALSKGAAAVVRHRVAVVALGCLALLPVACCCSPHFELALLSKPTEANFSVEATTAPDAVLKPRPWDELALDESIGRVIPVPDFVRDSAQAELRLVETKQSSSRFELDQASSKTAITKSGESAQAAEPIVTGDSRWLQNVTSINVLQLLPIMWLTGTLVLLGWWATAWIAMAVRVGRLPLAADNDGARIALEFCCKRLGWNGAIDVRIDPRNQMPMMFGMFRPVVIVPGSFREWPVDQQRSVMLHEVTHVIRRDLVADRIGWIAVSIWWWNPLVWGLRHVQELACEQACDENVLSHLDSPEEYAQHLLAVVREVRHGRLHAAIAMAKHGRLAARVRKIIAYMPSASSGRLLSTLTVTILPLLLGLVSAVRLVPSETSDREPSRETLNVPPDAIADSALTSDSPAQNLTDTQEEATDESENEAKAKQAREERFRLKNGDPIEAVVSAQGAVVDATGNPVPDVQVLLCEIANYRVQEMYELGLASYSAPLPKTDFSFAKTQTDENGKFQFENIAAPPYSSRKEKEFRWEVIAASTGSAIAWKRLPGSKNPDPVQLVLNPEYELQGTVTDDDGKPVSEVEIYVAGIAALDSPQFDRKDRPESTFFYRSTISPTAITDSKGRFALDQLPANRRVTLNTIHPNFLRQSSLIATTDQPAPPFKGRKHIDGRWQDTDIPLDSGEARITLDSGYRIRAKLVYAESGEPFPGAKINAFSTKTVNHAVGITGMDGEVELGIFSDGTTAMSIILPKETPLVVRPQKVLLEGDVRVKKMELLLESGRLIQGRVYSPGASVSALTAVFCPTDQVISNIREYYSSRLNSDGTFAIRVPSGLEGVLTIARDEKDHAFDLPPLAIATYTALNQDTMSRFGQHGPRIKVNATTDGSESAPLTIDVSPSPVIKGKVVDEEGERVLSAEFELLNQNRFSYHFGFASPIQPPKVKVDENGNYELSGLQSPFPAVYRISDRKNNLVKIVTFSVSMAPQIVLEKAVEIRGRVLWNGEPLADQKVEAIVSVRFDNNGKRSYGYDLPLENVRSSTNGEYVFKNVPQGSRVELKTRRTDREVIERPIGVIESPKNILVPDFEFVSLSGKLVGVVVDPSGNPVAGAELSVREFWDDSQSRRDINSRRNYTQSSDGRHEPQVTDSNGRFSIDHLPENVSLELYANAPQEPGQYGKPRAKLIVTAGEETVRIVLDPKLRSRPKRRD